MRPRGATRHAPLADLVQQDRARKRAGHCRNEPARFTLDESDQSDELAMPAPRSTHHAQPISAPETRSSSRRNRCRSDDVCEIPIAPLILKRPSVGPRLPSLEVCGRRPPWRHRRPGGAGIRKPSHERSSVAGQGADVRLIGSNGRFPLRSSVLSSTDSGPQTIRGFPAATPSASGAARLFHWLCFWECPATVEDFCARPIHSDGVIPPFGYGQAIWRRSATVSEANPN